MCRSSPARGERGDEGMNEVLDRQHRIAVGRCPQCDCAIVVVNDYRSWPLVACSACNWQGGIGGEMFEERIIEVGQRMNLWNGVTFGSAPAAAVQSGANDS